ncbi:MAG: NAD(P)-dependent oxidoreductase [Pseudomonadota bacterium]|nr:NAD(P)-dependent oxidoreductase [Pseudomonadota bacterium]
MISLPYVTWIGLGKMGLPMADRLVEAGYSLTVHNRTMDKCDALTAKGVAAASSVAEAVVGGDIVISMVADDDALADVALGDSGVLTNAAKGSLFIDMSTVSPVVSERIAAAAEEVEIKYLRAPVNGSVVQAATGGLVILASGPKDGFETAEPLFEIMGDRKFYIGPEEQARYLKLSINIMIGITASMTGEALAFGEAGGLNWADMIDIIASSAIGSPVINYKTDTLKNRDFRPAFTARQMAKDFDLALTSAAAAGVPLPVTGLVRQHWNAMIGTGRGEVDFFGYVELLEDLAGIKRD